MLKKIVVSTLVVFGTMFLVGGWAGLRFHSSPAATAASGELIRLHVIANSDSDADQAAKLAVRDSIVEYLAPKLRDASDVNAARAIVIENRQMLRLLAVRALAQHGMDYDVDIEMGQFDFPVRSYGSLVLPSGRYEAVRIVLGTGLGRNWWCVLFPPLCFIDGTTNAVAASALAPQETSSGAGSRVEFRSKLAEWLNR